MPGDAVPSGTVPGDAVPSGTVPGGTVPDKTVPGGSGLGGTADIGVVVADGWQGRGVGSALMRELVSSAQVRGVTAMNMDVRHDNQRVLAMITGHWPGARTTRSSDCLTLRVELPPGPPAPYPGLASRPRAGAGLSASLPLPPRPGAAVLGRVP